VLNVLLLVCERPQLLLLEVVQVRTGRLLGLPLLPLQVLQKEQGFCASQKAWKKGQMSRIGKYY
jgi:hypothetical protein